LINWINVPTGGRIAARPRTPFPHKGPVPGA
jgi:hypothetical protein